MHLDPGLAIRDQEADGGGRDPSACVEQRIAGGVTLGREANVGAPTWHLEDLDLAGGRARVFLDDDRVRVARDHRAREDPNGLSRTHRARPWSSGATLTDHAEAGALGGRVVRAERVAVHRRDVGVGVGVQGEYGLDGTRSTASPTSITSPFRGSQVERT